MAKAKVIDYRRFPSPDPKRLGKQDVMRVVEVDGGARVVVRVPAEADTPEALKAAVKAELEDRGKNLNQEFEI